MDGSLFAFTRRIGTNSSPQNITVFAPDAEVAEALLQQHLEELQNGPLRSLPGTGPNPPFDRFEIPLDQPKVVLSLYTR